ncbi:prenyltransferase/squalene oxidase repeat-containing protein [Kitasatospora sp. NBC_01302]|uniref:prenyltransferase/squalene oxidase repeat-containing protein n=1 Tax=Kitasatospora sp. NBC_01302 TaxID=2903575 RepID=UPI002E14160F|nr:terpene cyclase/mutase family protein [Kitasatospora sp. NBC_01302]
MPTPARTGAALLTAALLTGLVAGPALADTSSSPSPATPASPSPVAPPAALYGKGDPTYDGVWRQAMALMALNSAKVTPGAAAVDWLTGQQCADGGWPSFRADAKAACTAATEDSNATALAMQALVALGGHQAAVDKGVQWLKTNQNSDGSWSYNPGSPGDADSTGLAVSALRAAGADPTQVAKDGRTGLTALGALQLGCAAPAEQRGALAYQAAAAGQPASANALATAQATLAIAGGSLPVAAGSPTGPAPKAPECATGTDAAAGGAASAESAAAYLATTLAAGGQHLTLSTPGAAAPSPDYSGTTWAVLSLVRSGHPQQAAGAVDWLAANGGSWTKGPAGPDAGATAALILAAQAAGRDPHSFGGTDLVKQLTDSGPAVQTAAKESKKKSGFSPWLLGCGVLIGIGGGLAISLSRKRGQ